MLQTKLQYSKKTAANEIAALQENCCKKIAALQKFFLLDTFRIERISSSLFHRFHLWLLKFNPFRII